MASTAGLYCWKNQQGQTVCGDAAPTAPESNSDRRVLNSQGQTVKVLPHAKTDAELAADAQARRDRQAQQDQARYDQYLLSTYEKLEDLLRTRDDRLAALDGNIHINELSLKSEQDTLDSLNASANVVKSKGNPVPPGLAKKIQTVQNEQATEQQGLETRKQERAALAAKFDRDIARYKVLKASPSPGN